MAAGFPRLLESPGFFVVENSRTWKVLEKHFGPGKSWKNILENYAFFIGSNGKQAVHIEISENNYCQHFASWYSFDNGLYSECCEEKVFFLYIKAFVGSEKVLENFSREGIMSVTIWMLKQVTRLTSTREYLLSVPLL